MYSDQVNSFLACKNGSVSVINQCDILHINKIKDKTCINFSTDAGKLLDKIQAVFMIKNSQQIA